MCTSLGHTTQSKLTVQALGFGERGSRQMSRPWLTGGSVHPCTLPRMWGRLNGSLLFCLRKDVADVSHCVPRLGTGRRLFGRRHISCASSYASLGSCSRLRREVGLGSQASVDVCFGDSEP
ncbi:MAG: hypothetical protein NHB14_07895 [Desulfosporosinus sp.]|nr:hypothetical protein [Desulfosporosinus sp.]